MLLDTHTLVWAMSAPENLSGPAKAALTGATARCVSAVSLHEITYKARLGKWPEVSGWLDLDLDARLRSEGFEVISATGAIMQRAGRFDWAHRDPFDRIIVATTIECNLSVVSKDAMLDTAPGQAVDRIW